VGDFRLVCYLAQFMVCLKTRRLINDDERLVWIYGKERREFCLVGLESAVYALPAAEQSNFFGDRFTFAIDEVDANNKTTEGGRRH
jgi:hypothetical protein